MALSAKQQEAFEQDKADALEAVERYGGIAQAASALGVPRGTLSNRYRRALEDVDSAPRPTPSAAAFEAETLPEDLPPADEIIARRKKQYARKKQADDARSLINVKVRLDGPFGICHMGDPHVDDDGTDIADIERHVKIINDTEGLFGANVGDHQNNWIGRLARLYGEQSTSAAEAWVLTEWLVTSVNWLYILGGNHDCWSGAGDPVRWMTRDQMGVSENWGARLNLICPNGKEVRVNARHDFPGHSMWNTAHGASKAAQMGWRDHILTCGHKHTSGYQLLKCPAIRCSVFIHNLAGGWQTSDWRTSPLPRASRKKGQGIMTGQRLSGSGPILPPVGARALYLREAKTIPWDREKSRLVSRQFRALKRIWQFDPKPDNSWKDPDYELRGNKVIAVGNCNDFSPILKDSLITAGLPEEALHLVICEYNGDRHMVLAIETSRGTLICCNVTGCWALGRPALRHHTWIAKEAPGRPWESLQAVGLGDLLPN